MMSLSASSFSLRCYLSHPIARICSTNLVSRRSLSLAGIFPPIPTPFGNDENILVDKLEHNFKKWQSHSFSGYVVQGSNGEYNFLTWSERVRMISRVKKLMENEQRDSKLLIAGSGCESTMSTIQLGKEMVDAGADALLVVTPCFYKSGMTDVALAQHFETVADHSSAPIILYSVPANTGLDLPPDVIIKLAKHPNIVGLKDSGGDVPKLARIVYETRNDDFQVLAGSGSFLLPALHSGCVGGVLAVANVLGDASCRIVDLFNRGEITAATELQYRLILPNNYVTRILGVPGLKAAMDMLGYYGGPTRKPLLPLNDNQRATLRTVLENAGFMNS